jgi:hypothetical protein
MQLLFSPLLNWPLGGKSPRKSWSGGDGKDTALHSLSLADTSCTLRKILKDLKKSDAEKLALRHQAIFQNVPFLHGSACQTLPA